MTVQEIRERLVALSYAIYRIGGGNAKAWELCEALSRDLDAMIADGDEITTRETGDAK